MWDLGCAFPMCDFKEFWVRNDVRLQNGQFMLFFCFLAAPGLLFLSSKDFLFMFVEVSVKTVTKALIDMGYVMINMFPNFKAGLELYTI